MTRWLNVAQVATETGTSIPTVRRAIRSGALPAWRLQPGGRLLRIREADVHAWLASDAAARSSEPAGRRLEKAS